MRLRRRTGASPVSRKAIGSHRIFSQSKRLRFQLRDPAAQAATTQSSCWARGCSLSPVEKEPVPPPTAEPACPCSPRAANVCSAPVRPQCCDLCYEALTATAQEPLGSSGGSGGWFAQRVGQERGLLLLGANVKVSLNKVLKRPSNPSPVCQIQKGAGGASGGEENTKTQALYIDVRVKVATLECSVFLSR